MSSPLLSLLSLSLSPFRTNRIRQMGDFSLFAPNRPREGQRQRQQRHKLKCITIATPAPPSLSFTPHHPNSYFDFIFIQGNILDQRFSNVFSFGALEMETDFYGIPVGFTLPYGGGGGYNLYLDLFIISI